MLGTIKYIVLSFHTGYYLYTMEDEQVIIECPAPELLTCNLGPLVCPICQRTFGNSSALRFHRIKVHRLIQNEDDFAFSAHRPLAKPPPTRYHCPAVTCKYHVNKERYFTELRNLKQHYMNMHAEKLFSCLHCGLKFGLQRIASRHEKTCAVRFVCGQCGLAVATRNELQIHSTSFGHTSGFTTVNKSEQDSLRDSCSIVSLNTRTITDNTASIPPWTVADSTGPLPQSEATYATLPRPQYTVPETATTVLTPQYTVPETSTTVPTPQCTVPASYGKVSVPEGIVTGNTMSLTHTTIPETSLMPVPLRQATISTVPLILNTNVIAHSTIATNVKIPDAVALAISDTPIVSYQGTLESKLQNTFSNMSIVQTPTTAIANLQCNAVPEAVTAVYPDSIPQIRTSNSTPSLILPKPDAVYIPNQWKPNQNNASPIVIIFNNTVSQPRSLVPIAPKRSFTLLEETNLTSQPGAVISEKFPAATCELAVQTAPFQYTTHKHCAIAETQTCNLPIYNRVEMQSKSSQVSPNCNMNQHSDGITALTENLGPIHNRRRKRTEAGSQTSSSGKRSVCIGTPPKRQKKRRNAAVNCITTVKDVETQSEQLIDAVHMQTQSCPQHQLTFINDEQMIMPVQIVETSESLNMGTLSSENLRAIDVALQPAVSVQMPPKPSIEMVSVSTDMSKANISVGTMPSSPLPLTDASFSTVDFPIVSMNTIGTDPLPGFSGSPPRDMRDLSEMFSQETQTSFWAEIQASIAENNATQTMESYLANASMTTNTASLTMPVMMESSGVQTCHAQNSQTQTLPLLDSASPSQSKSVGVGTSLLGESHSSSLFEGIESEGLSRSIGIDTQLFDDLFPEVSSRSVAISTPLFDNMHSLSTASNQPAVMENVLFQPGHQRSVGGQFNG